MIPAASPPLRVLIAAEHASTRLGGEAILPFHYFRILRTRGIDAFLIVHERTRDELLSLFPEDHARIHFIQDQALQKLFYRLGRILPRRIDEATLGLANQLLTQRAQRRVVRSLATSSSVVHQPIPVSPRFPSLLAGLGSPLIVGPLNGGMDYPRAFAYAESFFSRVAIAIGRTISNLVNAMVPGKLRAAVVLVANRRTRSALPTGIQGCIVELSENAVDLAQWAPSHVPPPQQASTFLFIGRLVEWKALDLALEALARVPGASLEIVGDGPMLIPWQKLTDDLGLEQRVKFSGWLTQPECAERLRQACALLLPSLYECGGAVVLEAMACARPVIATAWGGPAEYLDESCGILIPPIGREPLIAGFAQAMAILLASPETATRLGANGRDRLIQNFDWEKKVDRMLEIYRSILPTLP